MNISGGQIDKKLQSWIDSLQKWVDEQRYADDCEEGCYGWMDAVETGAVYHQLAVLRPIADDDYGSESYQERPESET